ncbi:MAG: hypothetical protein EBR09_16145 [Proteobacteria bacterium]|nr:hypothetical protein [Pseudomonadota bacterium]
MILATKALGAPELCEGKFRKYESIKLAIKVTEKNLRKLLSSSPLSRPKTPADEFKFEDEIAGIKKSNEIDLQELRICDNARDKLKRPTMPAPKSKSSHKKSKNGVFVTQGNCPRSEL